MRILVTGGAGFIGSYLTDAFLTHGDQVAIVNNMSRSRTGHPHPSVDVHNTGIIDVDALQSVVDQVRPDLICHLAAKTDVRVSVAAPVQDATVNIIGTINVLEVARRVGARVILASTGGAIYGADTPVPAAEDDLTRPLSPYGVAKYCAEQYLGLYNRLHGTAHSALRLANVYGPHQSATGGAGVIRLFCESAVRGERPMVFGDGRQTRDYVHVQDVAAAFLAAARTERSGVWNIGTGQETSVLDLIDLVSETSGTTLSPVFNPARPGEVLRSALDARAALRDLNWKPHVDLADGVSEVYRWVVSGVAEPSPTR